MNRIIFPPIPMNKITIKFMKIKVFACKWCMSLFGPGTSPTGIFNFEVKVPLSVNNLRG